MGSDDRAPEGPGRDRARGMSRGTTVLFAVAGGVAVGNLYRAQPLLADMAADLGVSAGMAGLLVTLTQVGYALGVLLVVPLGDTLDRRRLIPVIMVCSALALALGASAAAPSFTVLLATLALVGATTVTGQLLTPLADDLADDEERGQVVGTVASGLLTGILVSRTISGLVAGVFGWRGIYVVAAALTLVFALVLARSLPSVPPRATSSYAGLLRSVARVVHLHRAVQVTPVLGATVFGVFTLFWTGLTVLLSSAPFGYSVTQIGLVGLVGLAGALAARRAGRLHDRGWSVPATGAGLALTLVALLVAALGSTSLAVVLVAVLLLDVGVQGVNVLNQTRMLSVDESARSRLNTAFVTSDFIGGAVGSVAAGLLWQAGGWVAVALGGAVLIAAALVIWVAQRVVMPPSTANAAPVAKAESAPARNT